MALPAAALPSVVLAWRVTVLLAVTPAWFPPSPREDIIVAVLRAVSPALFAVVFAALLGAVRVLGGVPRVAIARCLGAVVVISAVAGAGLAAPSPDWRGSAR